MTGPQYADLIATYISKRFASRSLAVYREVEVGKTLHGKKRRVDIFCVAADRAFAIECKFQDSKGTADEKISFALDDIVALPISGCIAYAGQGFSDGVRHRLASSPHAAYCLPVDGQIESSADTRALDHALAMHFGWWEVLIEGKKPI